MLDTKVKNFLKKFGKYLFWVRNCFFLRLAVLVIIVKGVCPLLLPLVSLDLTSCTNAQGLILPKFYPWIRFYVMVWSFPFLNCFANSNLIFLLFKIEDCRTHLLKSFLTFNSTLFDHCALKSFDGACPWKDATFALNIS